MPGDGSGPLHASLLRQVPSSKPGLLQGGPGGRAPLGKHRHPRRARAGRAGGEGEGVGGGQQPEGRAQHAGLVVNGDRGPGGKAGPRAGPHRTPATRVCAFRQNPGCEADSLWSKRSLVSGKETFHFQPPFGPRHYLGDGKGPWKLYQRGSCEVF